MSQLEPPETRLETVAELRQMMAGRVPTVRESLDVDTEAFRPSLRPSLAFLCIIDDGQDDGEWLRLRRERTTLGRAGCDILIEHDTLVSGRHAELVRDVNKETTSWTLFDLKSTNGVFVRVSSAAIGHGQELLLGQGRFRLATLPTPALVELTPQGEGRRFALTEDNWIGRDAQACNVVPGPDRALSPRHARLRREPNKRWQVTNAGSINGVWVRVPRVALENNAMFQLGEQRFLFKVPT